MKTAGVILMEKGDQPVWTVRPDDSVYSALALMAEKDIGAVLVVENNELLGILSERDYARKVILKGRMSRDTLVRDIMTGPVMCVPPTRTVDECMALMTDKRIRHLPVIDAGKLVGIVSIGDLVKAQIAERDFEISQLTDYITGRIR